MKHLLQLYKKKTRVLIGLISGTSHDGIDASLVKIKGTGIQSQVRLLCHHHVRYKKSVRDAIRYSFAGDTHTICRLNYQLGRIFAKAALEGIEKSGIDALQIDAIASHGQTICHIPPQSKRSHGSTLQIAEPAVIAELTGLPVVSDFRAADVSAGGHGAPLVPYADYVLFGGTEKTRLILNIGGIANLTVLTPFVADVFAFDCGPGNAMIDEAMVTLFNKPMDRDGRIANRGTLERDLLNQLMSLPYLRKSPPKSADRQLFGMPLIRDYIYKRKKEDIVCTLTHFTVESITYSIRRFVLKKCTPEELIVTGGGCRNKYMMDLLQASLPDLEIRQIDKYGIPYQAKEAMSFAILGNETLSGKPSNIPYATGAWHPAILGKISLPFKKFKEFS